MIWRQGPPLIEKEGTLYADEKPDPVFEWRREQLLVAGYTEHQAEALAGNRLIDLHGAIRLIEQCRDAGMAFDILS